VSVLETNTRARKFAGRFCGTVLIFSLTFESRDQKLLKQILERATGIEPAPPAWESKLSILYFQYLQNRLGKINVHATHTVHALPDLRMTGGRLGDGFSSSISVATALFGAGIHAIFETG
jgi:hypothetical protein